MQIVGITPSSEIVLNQGGGTLSDGDQLVLVEEGQAFVDPYTHEELGKAQTPIGLIEIVRSDGKLAYARGVGKLAAPLEFPRFSRQLEAGL